MPDPDADRAAAVPLFEVVFETPDGIATIHCRRDEYILDAAERHDLRLPFICRQGQCLTCAGRLISGSVDQSDACQYFPEDREAGFVLLCRGRPLADLRIRTHQQWEMRRFRQEHGLPAPYA